MMRRRAQPGLCLGACASFAPDMHALVIDIGREGVLVMNATSIDVLNRSKSAELCASGNLLAPLAFTTVGPK